ncbi:MAG: GNAT family N-acetyltransferase [Aquabacterium sp.]
MTAAAIVIHQERPDQPEVRALLDELDAYLSALYEPEANHILDIQALLAPQVRFFVARDAAGQVLATGAWRRMDGEPASGGQPYGEVKRMVVQPGQRGRGFGRMMLEVVETSMRSEGIALAMLETGEAQTEAVGLYQRCGYRRCGPYAAYPDNGLSVFMVKSLVRA